MLIYKTVEDACESSKVYYSSLLHQIDDEKLVNKLTLLFDETFEKHLDLFSDSFWIESYSNYEVSPFDYILPAIRKAFFCFFMKIPPIIKHDEKKIQLYGLLFDLRELLESISKKLKNNLQKLSEDFKNLDIISEVLELIVDDYCATKLNQISAYKVTEQIRDIKLKKHLNIE